MHGVMSECEANTESEAAGNGPSIRRSEREGN